LGLWKQRAQLPDKRSIGENFLFQVVSGAGDGDRTRDPLLGKRRFANSRLSDVGTSSQRGTLSGPYGQLTSIVPGSSSNSSVVPSSKSPSPWIVLPSIVMPVASMLSQLTDGFAKSSLS